MSEEGVDGSSSSSSYSAIFVSTYYSNYRRSYGSLSELRTSLVSGPGWDSLWVTALCGSRWFQSIVAAPSPDSLLSTVMDLPRAMVPSLHHTHTHTRTPPRRGVSKDCISLSVYHSRYEIDPGLFTPSLSFSEAALSSPPQFSPIYSHHRRGRRLSRVISNSSLITTLGLNLPLPQGSYRQDFVFYPFCTKTFLTFYWCMESEREDWVTRLMES